MSEKIRELAETLNKMAKGHVKVQTIFAVVKSVDWDAKTMVATGVKDDLDNYNVLLGFGSYYVKPTVGTKCIIGMLENIDSANFLMYAEAADEIVFNGKKYIINSEEEVNINAPQTNFNGGENGGMVIVQNLVDRLNTVEQDLNTLKQIINAWTIPGAPDAGAALKTALTGNIIAPALPGSWAASTINETTTNDLANNDVKH